MERLGSNTLLYSQDFIIPEGEEVEIAKNLEGWNLKIKIKFEQNAEEQGLSITPIEDHAVITFHKWDNGLGTCTSKPIELGTHGTGKKVYFLASNFCIGGTNKLTFQLLMEGQNE